MRHSWKLSLLLLLLALNGPAPAFLDGGGGYWSAYTYVGDDGATVYADSATETSFEVFWISMDTTLSGPGGSAYGSDYTYGRFAQVHITVPIGPYYGYYSASSSHTVMDNDGMGYYTWTNAYDFVPASPPPPPPTISGTSPSPAYQGTNRSLQVSGTGFRPGAVLGSSDPGISISGSYASEGSLSASYTASPGTYTITVSQDSGSASASFTVYEATPIISAIYPSTWQAGTVYSSATVSGSFLGTVCPSFAITGAFNSTFTPTACADGSVSGTLAVDPNAPAGTATLTLSANGYGQGFQGPVGSSNQGTITAGVCPIPLLRVTSDGASVSSNQTVYVGPAPQMPAISASLLPAAPGCPLTGTASYQLSTSYYDRTWAYPSGPAAPQSAGSPFNVPTSSFFGGQATLSWYYNGFWQPSFTFSILGQNPSAATVEAALGGWSTNIANHESAMKQFAATGLPLKDYANGYGVMQLTTPIPTEDQRWNWRSNVAGGQNLLQTNMTTASSFWQYQIVEWQKWNDQNPGKVVGPAKDRWESASCTFSMVGHGLTFDQAIGLKRYAGEGNPAMSFISWNNTQQQYGVTPSWSVHPENGVRPDIVFEFCTCATLGSCQHSGVGYDMN